MEQLFIQRCYIVSIAQHLSISEQLSYATINRRTRLYMQPLINCYKEAIMQYKLMEDYEDVIYDCTDVKLKEWLITHNITFKIDIDKRFKWICDNDTTLSDTTLNITISCVTGRPAIVTSNKALQLFIELYERLLIYRKKGTFWVMNKWNYAFKIALENNWYTGARCFSQLVRSCDWNDVLLNVCKGGNVQILLMLIKEHGVTCFPRALKIASDYGYYQCVEIIIDYLPGGKYSIFPEHRKFKSYLNRALTMACINYRHKKTINHYRCIEILINRGANNCNSCHRIISHHLNK